MACFLKYITYILYKTAVYLHDVLAVSFNCISLSTGYGHIVPMTAWGRIFCIVYALFGIPLTCVVFKSVGTNINLVITNIISTVRKRFLRSKSQHLKSAESALVAVFLDIFALLLISLGAFFRRKEWTYLESFYFCFITFSTIGLGDFLPFEDTNVGVTEYLLMAVGIILGFSMMSTMLCALSQALEKATPLPKVKPLETTTGTNSETDLQNNNSVELLDIEKVNDTQTFQEGARKVSVGLVSI